MSIESYKLKNGLISRGYKFFFQGQVYRRWLGPVSLKHAKLAEQKARVQAAEGTHPPPRRQQRQTVAASVVQIPTFLEYAPTFLTSYAVDARPRSVRTYEDRLNLHILPYFSTLLLSQASTGVIDAYRTARRQEGASPNTINGELATLSRLLRSAVEWGYISKASLGMIHWLRIEERSIRVLSDVEEGRLLFGATPTLRPLIRFALQTGLRKMELLTLTWANIDLVSKEVTVVATVAKNRRSRAIPLNRAALEALKDARSKDGRVFGYHSISAPMDRVQKKTGLLGINCHSFRRTFATRCLEAGINIRTLQRWLGHSSLATTQKYVNPGDAYEKAAIELLGHKPMPHDEPLSRR